jgi:hypothetical protein
MRPPTERYIMKNFTSQNRQAQDVQEDDWFKMAGFLYRVMDTYSVDSSMVEFNCYPVHSGIPTVIVRVPRKQIFKIYNQK